MNDLKKVFAALCSLTMALSMASCGSSETSNSESSEAESSVSEETTAEIAEESSEASSEATTEESSEETSAEEYEMEQFSSEHEPYKLKFDYALPKLDKYELEVNSSLNPDYFNSAVIYHYKYCTDDKSLYGVRVTFTTDLYSQSLVEGKYQPKEGQTVDKTDNGYNLQYSVEEREDKNSDLGMNLSASLAVYGETYRDACLLTEIRVETYESDMTKDELEKLSLAIANTVKFTDWDENALFNSDGSIIAYPHRLSVPAKVDIAGHECETQLETQGYSPLVYAEFAEGDVMFRTEIDTFLLVNSSFENALTDDKYTPVTVNGYEALYQFEESSANGYFMIRLNEDHIEKVTISVPSMANGEMSMNGSDYFEARKELAADPAGTKNKYNEIANDFVSSWILDENGASTDSASEGESSEEEISAE